MKKKVERLRRAKRGRMSIREQEVTRLCVHKTPRHIYAQVIAPTSDRVLASASTLDKNLKVSSNQQVILRQLNWLVNWLQSVPSMQV